MRLDTRLFIIFFFAFTLAMSGAGLLSTNANAQCNGCGYSQPESVSLN
jgi:hypothetical protein